MTSGNLKKESSMSTWLLHPTQSAHVFIGNTIVVTSGVATTYPTGSHDFTQLPIKPDHASLLNYLSYRITWVYSTTYPTGSHEFTQLPILSDHMSNYLSYRIDRMRLLLGFVWFVLTNLLNVLYIIVCLFSIRVISLST